MTIHQVPKNFNPEAEPNWVRLIRMFITGEYPDTYLGKRFEGPTRGRIVVESFKAAERTLLPWLEALRYFGKREYWDAFRMNQIIPVRYEYKPNGSVFDIVSKLQAPCSFEGWQGDWVVMDCHVGTRDHGPYNTMVRGLLAHDGVIMV